MPRGGKRPGAGRPKGSKEPQTLEKEAAREALRRRVTDRLMPMTDAQIDNALGIKHLMLRDPKTGKFERVKDEAGIDLALRSEGEAVWIYTKDPSVQSFTDLMNRSLDKAAEQEQTLNVNLLGLAERIVAARKRVKQ